MNIVDSTAARVARWFFITVVILLSLASSASSQHETHKHRWPRLPFRGDPTVSVNYGFTQNTLNGLAQPLADPRAVELKLGSLHIEREEGGILSTRQSYFTLANISNEIGSKSSNTEINTDIWRFGVGWDKGYGYRLGESSERAIFLQHATGVTWSKLTVKGNVAAIEDKELLSLYDAFRFGTKAEATIAFRIAPIATISTGYERSAIFRRHLFWGWVGSVALEGAANWALDRFIDRILEGSPQAAPVVNFILKNGLSYGVYQLRREKMNYPFGSEPPIMNDTFKVGVTFIF